MKKFLVPTLFNRPRSLFADFNDFYSAFDSSISNSENTSLLADYRVHEEDGKYNIELDLPGVSDKDIDISINDKMLTVSAIRKREVKGENGEVVEKSVAKYERSFSISDKIDVENINAITRDGTLLLSLPLSEERSCTKKIEVNKNLEEK